jgi:2-dehydro-3-deoxygalactonokinase
MNPYLIGLDWGISSFRAYLMDDKGEVVDCVANQSGIMQVGERTFEDVLQTSIGSWLSRYPDTAILACGMIASSQGWIEAPYVSCPAGPAELVKHLCSVETQAGRKIWFVPGVMRRAEDHTPDVMRGEETQIFGAVKDNSSRFSFILPGTHSKWALVEKGQIVWFATFMTGELFDILCKHSILGRLMEESGQDDEAFLMGLECSTRGENRNTGLLNTLFSVRSRGLFEEIPKTGLKSYLSGLLIGAEVTEATRQIKDKTLMRLIGDRRLLRLYTKALEFFGWPSTMEPEHLSARGLACIAISADLK